MENYNETIKKLELIIEQSNTDAPACKNCCSYKNGGCSFGCMNERLRITSPSYSCSNFSAKYNLSESTVDIIRDIKSDLERVNEGLMNIKLLLSGKIDEKDFNEMMR